MSSSRPSRAMNASPIVAPHHVAGGQSQQLLRRGVEGDHAPLAVEGNDAACDVAQDVLVH